MSTVKLKKKEGFLAIGDKYPVVVNCNVGVNDIQDIRSEITKIDALFSKKETTPDTMMDLSIFESKGILAQYIIETYGIPVGVVPTYVFKDMKQLNKQHILEQIRYFAEIGISFMTMHITADMDIFRIAQKERKIPMTSRGGGIVLREAYRKNGPNIYRECLDEIISLAKKYNFTISLGTTFRPASIKDACDTAHILETKRQIELCHYLQKQGVSVIMENVGHISIDKIFKHSLLLKEANAPIMPLGPLAIDSAIGNDHIASSIGAAFMAYNGVAHIINAISPVEHLTSFFTTQNAIDAVISAKIAAQSINIIKFPQRREVEDAIYELRAMKHSCLISDSKNCERCNILCPLKTTLS